MPIVEPEVTLGPGDYSIEETAFWSERVYSHVFRYACTGSIGSGSRNSSSSSSRRVSRTRQVTFPGLLWICPSENCQLSIVQEILT